MDLIRDSLSNMGKGICLQARNILGQVSDHMGMAHDQRKRYNSAASLIFGSRRFTSFNELHCFSSISDQNFFKTCYPETNRFVVGSIEGWFIMVDDNQCWHPEGFSALSLFLQNSRTCSNFFLDRDSGEQVMLPSQSTIPCRGSNKPNFFTKVVATSLPMSPDCVVAALCKQGRLAFCRPTDESWTLIDRGCARGVEFCDAEIINGELHAAIRCAPEFLMRFNIEWDANRPPAYFAPSLERFEHVPIPPHITTKDGVLQVAILKELLAMKKVHCAKPKSVGKIESVFEQNWLTIQHYWMQAQAPAGLLCLLT